MSKFLTLIALMLVCALVLASTTQAAGLGSEAGDEKESCMSNECYTSCAYNCRGDRPCLYMCESNCDCELRVEALPTAPAPVHVQEEEKDSCMDSECYNTCAYNCRGSRPCLFQCESDCECEL
jgi:hypothetical protein